MVDLVYSEVDTPDGVLALAGVIDWNTAAFIAVSGALPWSSYEIIRKTR
jgi:hypothetical protein